MLYRGSISLDKLPCISISSRAQKSSLVDETSWPSRARIDSAFWLPEWDVALWISSLGMGSALSLDSNAS